VNAYAWIDCGNGRQVYRRIERREVARSHLPAPRIRPDGMAPTVCPIDGNAYDSKSQYERVVKANGCEIVGNDSFWDRPAPEFKPEGVKEDLKKAWDQLA
jgi:hypothetical protein